MTNSSGANKRLNFEEIRRRLSQSTGPRYWRSLEEVAETEEFRSLVESEFPSAFEPGVDRRNLLKVMAASFALAGLTACKYEPERRIVPSVVEKNAVPPNKPLYYATAMELGPSVVGLLAESHDGRPTKLEGNPQHPASLGATDIFSQASVLTLWDPDRSRSVLKAGSISSWDEFSLTLGSVRHTHQADRGAGLRILTRTVLSPTLGTQLGGLLAQFPSARWFQYDPVNRDNQRAGAIEAFGQDLQTRYKLENAAVVVSLDADFLGSGPGSLPYARAFARGRRVEETGGKMSRLYVVEPMPTCTGSIADHRFRARSSDIEGIARALMAEVSGGAAPSGAPSWVGAVARDLLAHRGRCVVIAGPQQPAAVHALAHAVNSTLGAIGATVILSAPVEASPSDQMTGLRQLVGEMNSGAVKTLVILDGNPVYNTPRDLRFLDALRNVPLRIHAGLYADETSRWAHWHVPLTHYLEHWSDTRAWDGTYSLVQPLILPLYGARSHHELVAALAGDPLSSGYDIVQRHWRQRRKDGDFTAFWQTALHDGVAETPSGAMKIPPVKPPAQAAAPAVGAIEVSFRPDPTIWDGAFSNSGWLQELPKPITKLTWDNAAHLSPATADRLNVRDNDIVEIRTSAGKVKAPVWVVPGHADDSITVHLGYGRTQSGRVGTGQGFDAYSIQSSAQPYVTAGQVKKLSGTWGLVPRQHHFNMENRHLVREASRDEYLKNPGFAQQVEPAVPKEFTLYPNYEYKGHAWGMAIDLNACIGCGACMIACQAENNISVVGKDQVARGRIMHWIRVDSYQQGSLDNPRFSSQPVPCMHCEDAPCEPVCPVGATSHSDEGLNQMVYNRCVGTRYCSNNCPYKVRRFNFFQFADYTSDSIKGVFNPDVTVRSRGVMEKCTYCVQRIEEAKIDAEKQGRPLRDGEIVTACQQVCPTEAIVFGDINDKSSRVAKAKRQRRDYGILTELNTRPRTTYQARIRNTNPEIKES